MFRLLELDDSSIFVIYAHFLTLVNTRNADYAFCRGHHCFTHQRGWFTFED